MCWGFCLPLLAVFLIAAQHPPTAPAKELEQSSKQEAATAKAEKAKPDSEALPVSAGTKTASTENEGEASEHGEEGAKKKGAPFRVKSNLRVVVSYPVALNFVPRRMPPAANERSIEPLELGPSRFDERYVSENYVDVMLVALSFAKAFEAIPDPDRLTIKNGFVSVLESRKKIAGDPGQLIKLRVAKDGKVYIKLLALFGDHNNTHVVVGLYPEDLSQSFIPDLIETAVNSAKASLVPGKKPS